MIYVIVKRVLANDISMNKKKKGDNMLFTEAKRVGVIPNLTELLIEEENDVINEFYKKLSKEEKNFIFKRDKIPLLKAVGLEKRIVEKIKKIRNSILVVAFLLISVCSAFAEPQAEYWEKNALIPKEYGRLIEIRDKWMFFEANDGTIRIIAYQIWDENTYYIGRPGTGVMNIVIKRK